ncbi:MAG: hypothetical protein KGI37_10335 [Alphaproteobacteria bacterium]|nr:hypothetical protein [Alphaproteobacteria bacterium]
MHIVDNLPDFSIAPVKGDSIFLQNLHHEIKQPLLSGLNTLRRLLAHKHL